MPSVGSIRILRTVKYEFSIKNSTTFFKWFYSKICFPLLNKKAFFHGKILFFFFKPLLKPKSIKSNNAFSRSLCGNFV